MITLNGGLKLSDFGVAEYISSFDDQGYVSKVQGSPAFQPPEIASGTERFAGVKGDIWAAGISLYYIVTGKYPFEGSTVYTLLENIAKAEYVIPSWVEQSLADLIRGMLEPDKNKRFTLRQITQHSWMQNAPESDDEDVEITPSRTLFTPEFIKEIEKIKDEGLREHSNAHKKTSCGPCVLV